MDVCKQVDCEATPTRKGYCERHYRPARRRGEVGWDGSICIEEGCSKPVVAKGRCQSHYQQAHRLKQPPCSVEGCEKSAHARGWCHTHYMRFVRWGDPLAWKKRQRQVCTIEGCTKPNAANGLCQMHDMRRRRTGTTEVPPKPIVVAPKRFECRHCGAQLSKGSKGFCSVEHREAYWYWERRRTGRAVGLKRRYGMTVEQVDEMLRAQDGRCAICRTDVPGGNAKKFQVDHCHTTNKVRGLLCHHCNSGLGQFKDNPDYLRAAVDYLSRC